MFLKPLRIVLMPVLLIALIALSVPAYSAENATITGDKVRMRYYPSVSGASYVLKSLDSGTRVEILERTDFTDSVEGYIAPWYRVKHGKDTGYVFGRYVGFDAGVTVNPIDPSTAEYFSNIIFRFVDAGLDTFGTSESDIIKRLGKPISITEYDAGLLGAIFEGQTYYRLTYDEIIFEMEGSPGQGSIWAMSCTTGSNEFNGLRVGGSAADVKRLLGEPESTDCRYLGYPFRIVGDTLIYPDCSAGDALIYRSWMYVACFRISNGKVTEVTLYINFYD